MSKPCVDVTGSGSKGELISDKCFNLTIERFLLSIQDTPSR